MRIAAIDCGSNSFHLLIADVDKHDQLSPIENNKSLLRLGAEVAQKGIITNASLVRSKRVIKHYKNLIAMHNVDEVVCVATSAIRSASNGDEVIAALSKTLGHKIRVISGDEEAKTIFRAISALSTLPETRILASDMGGGSLELMCGQRNGLEYAVSVPLGASRVSKELKVSDPLTGEDLENIQTLFKKHTEKFSSLYPANLFSHLIVSSGTLNAITNMARAAQDNYIPSPLVSTSASTIEIREICQNLIALSPQERRSLLGYDSDRDDSLPTAAAIVLEMTKLVSETTSWTTSPYALREGLALMAADKHLNDEIPSQNEVAQATINRLFRQMELLSTQEEHKANTPHSDIATHCKNVDYLASSIFDQLQEIHKLSIDDKKLLSYACQIHKIGTIINHSKHDQHGAYILSNIALAGFSSSDATILRAVIRWHKNKTPKKSDQSYGRLNDKDFKKAKWLCAILRLADGADSAENGNVIDIDISIKPDVIFFRFVSNNDCEIEIYSARRKRSLIEEMSSRDIIIQPALQPLI